MSLINSKNWTLFVKQAKGLGIDSVHVAREDKGAHAVIKYNGKARNGRIVSAEWKIDLKEKDAARDPAAIEKEIRDFLEKARKSFFVKREGGLGGDSFKGKQDDEAEKAKTLGPADKAADKA